MFARRDFTSADGAYRPRGALGVLAAAAADARAARPAERAAQQRLFVACVDGDMATALAALDAGAVLHGGRYAPLHAACANGHRALVDALIEHALAHADRHPDAFGLDDQGRSPLLIALAGSHTEIAGALLRAGGVDTDAEHNVADWLIGTPQ